MIKRLLSGVIVASFMAYFLASLPSYSGVTCSLPFNLTNGTTADASQVMANYNALAACMLNNLAASGANSDITSLSGLTTPLTPAQGGSAVYVGRTVAGMNTVTIGATTPANFALTTGNIIVFIAAGTNTGATTLNVVGTGAVAVDRLVPNGAGLAGFSGGEWVGATIAAAVYDGTEFVTLTNGSPGVPGSVIDYPVTGGQCPLGYLLADGTSHSTALFPFLSSLLGTSWGNPGGGFFAMPDLQGRATFGLDGTGTRITAAGGNFDGAVVGHVGGQQNWTLTQAQLPTFTQTPTTALTFSSSGTNSYTPAGSVSVTMNSVTPTGTVTATDNTHVVGSLAGTGSAIGVFNTLTPAASLSLSVNAFTPTTMSTSFSGNAVTLTGTVSAVTFGSGASHPVLSNAAIVLKCVKT